MKKLIPVPAYLWAIACLILVPVTFIKNDTLAAQLAHLSFMKIHPKYSGGKVVRSYLNKGLQVTVHEPVYSGISGKGFRGFVQVSFAAIDSLPGKIHEIIDYDLDDIPDFTISVNTKTGATLLDAAGPQVLSLEVSSRVKADWVVRLNIKRGEE